MKSICKTPDNALTRFTIRRSFFAKIFHWAVSSCMAAFGRLAIREPDGTELPLSCIFQWFAYAYKHACNSKKHITTDLQELQRAQVQLSDQLVSLQQQLQQTVQKHALLCCATLLQ